MKTYGSNLAATLGIKYIFPLLIICCCIFSFSSYGENYNYRVIIVSSYHQDLEKYRNMIPKLKSELLSNTVVQTLYMDSKRIKSAQLKDKADEILAAVSQFYPDVIFLCDDNAVKFLATKLLLMKHRIVFLGVNENPRKYVAHDQFHKLKGVLERPLYLRGILELQPFYPSAEKVTILMDNTFTSNIIKKSIFRGKASTNSNELSIDFKQIRTFQELKAFILALNTKPQQQLFLTSLFNLVDESTGKKMNNSDVLTWVRINYKRPIFSFWKTKVELHQILAAYGISEQVQGQAAAKIGNAILLNQEVNNIMTPEKGNIFISQQQLDKFDLKISENLLANSNVIVFN